MIPSSLFVLREDSEGERDIFGVEDEDEDEGEGEEETEAR
jgi:hypothetical protein